MSTRRERVVLELVDDLSPGMVKAAAATKLLDRNLQGLDGTTIDTSRTTERSTKSTKEFTLAQAIAAEESARLRKNLRDQARALIDARDGTAALGRDTDHLGASSRKTSADINQLSGRLSLLLRGVAVLGPALAPISTVAVAGVAGLSSQLGFAATGAISLAAAAQGVGDALKAVNDAALEPTAANLEKAREAMSKIGPDAQAFVARFQEIRPALRDIRDSAAAGWFPGLTESLTSLERVAPEVASLFEKIGTVGGNLVAEGAAALAGPGWADFRRFIAAEAPQALDDLGRTLGNVAKGLSELWMAFGPLNSSFSSWLLDASRSFAQWADGLAETEGFAEFVDYIRTNGPKVAAAAKAIGNAFLQIAEAAAPLGGPILDALTGIADAIAAIADSPLGTPIMVGVTAMSALTLATNLATAAMARLGIASKAAGAAAAGAGAAGKGGMTGLLAGNAVGASALAMVQAGLNTTDTFSKAKSGENGFGESILRTIVPAIPTLEAFGVKIPGLTNDAKDLADATADAGGAMAGLTTRTRLANEAAEDLDSTLTTLSAVLTKQGAYDAYQASLDNLTESIKRNGQTLDANTEKGRENRANLNAIAELAAKYAENLEGADRKRYLRGAIQDFKAGAEAAGGLDRRSREVLQALRDLANVKVAPKISLEADAALAEINQIRNGLGSLRDKTIRIRTIRQATGSKFPDLDRDVGGFTGPGGKYEPAGVVHRGEVVIPQELVRRDKSMLMSRYGSLPGMDQLPGFARGGLAGGRGGFAYLDIPDNPLSGLIQQLDFKHLNKSLKQMAEGLDKSRDALAREVDARTSLADSLAQGVTGSFTSSLFGGGDVWARGSTLLDAIAKANGDTAGATSYSQNLAKLTGMGLDGAGLEALLADVKDPTELATIAATATPEIIQQYEDAVAARTAANASLAAQIGASVNPGLAAMQAELVKLNAQLAALNSIQKAAPAATGKATAKAGKKGAGNGGRNIKKG